MSESSVEPRPSRQDLVVPPPRSATWPSVVGSAACAVAGFAVVWTLGLGKAPTPGGAGPDAPAVVDGAAEPGLDGAASSLNQAGTGEAPEPDLLPRADDALPIDAPSRPDRWSRQAARSAAAAQPDEAVVEDHASRPVSLDLPDAVLAPAEPRRISHDATAPAADQVLATTSTDTADPDSDLPRADGIRLPETTADEVPLVDGPGTTDRASAAEPGPSGPAADALADAPLPEDPGDMAALPEPLLPPPARAPVASAFGAAPAAFGSGPPEGPLAHPSAFAPGVAAPAPAPSGPLSTAPPQPLEPPPAAAGSPFAAAPPVLAEEGAGEPDFPAPPAARLAANTSLGHPGPLQLEGIQTPQVTVEKRGPREISVGKPARYEIMVRNVGSATAHEVMLQDAVPHGTTLVATTPPASPVTQASGAADGSLVWPLGTLPPGGQAVVTMEVMPQVEGEIGSVASVSFRTDASVRSRATKPDLRIECASPQPVLIGRDLQVTITVTNPGSGAATGVVLEGFLPDNVSHRSGRELEFDVGQLRPGESRTIDLVLGTRAPGVHAAQLVARADGGVEVKHQVPIEVTAPTLELAVDMPLRRFLQRPATCSIGMVNAGTAPARAIELAVQLPPGLKFVKANNAGWHDDRANRVLWNLEELPAGETGTVQVVVMPVELGPQRITAAARSADGLACQAGHTCDVEGLAALSFEVLDSEDPIELDGITDYVVRVGNQGTKPATGVRLAATLLGDLEPVEAQGPASHRIDNLTISFEPLAKLAPAEEAVFRIRARGRRAGDQRIQVQLTSADQPAPITKEETTRVYADR